MGFTMDPVEAHTLRLHYEGGAESLTIVLECFHLVSLFNILSRLIQENRFLQQNWLLSPAS